MLLFEKLENAEMCRFDQVTEYCKEHKIELSFSISTKTTVSLVENVTSANHPDCLIYVVNATAQDSTIAFLKENTFTAIKCGFKVFS